MNFEIGELVYIDSYSTISGLAEVTHIENYGTFPCQLQILNWGIFHGKLIYCAWPEVQKLTEAASLAKLITYVAK
jgi:hypothetical protein